MKKTPQIINKNKTRGVVALERSAAKHNILWCNIKLAQIASSHKDKQALHAKAHKHKMALSIKKADNDLTETRSLRVKSARTR